MENKTNTVINSIKPYVDLDNLWYNVTSSKIDKTDWNT